MECNKEEASRAMDIAKKKVTENDYEGAKKFVYKAQKLYPELDGLRQVLMMVNVYISATNGGGGGEADWYGILGVDPLADDVAVKRQYKKLALLLHPDKNKFNGAEGAFKLVSEAWMLLSDKVKRIAYDQKRKSKEVKPRKPRKQQKQAPNQKKQRPNQPQQQPPNPQKQPPNKQPQPPNQQQQQQPNLQKQPPNQQQQPSPQKQQPNQPSANGFGNGRGRSNKRNSEKQKKVGTFLTMCNKCGSEYEYLRAFYLNKTLVCRNCRVSFIATEKQKTTPTEKKKTPQATNKDANGASSCGRDSSVTDSVGQKDCSNCGSVANQAEERVKRAVEEDAAARGIANSDRVFKKLRTDDYAGASCGIKV